MPRLGLQYRTLHLQNELLQHQIVGSGDIEVQREFGRFLVQGVVLRRVSQGGRSDCLGLCPLEA